MEYNSGRQACRRIFLPDIEEWARKSFFRYNSDIEEYNKKAVEVLSPLGVIFNDLYSVTKDFKDSMRSDWVHYGEGGSRALAKVVTDLILKIAE